MPMRIVTTSIRVTARSVQVRSLTLDVRIWDEAVLGMMERIGNRVANEAWEAELANENARSALALHAKGCCKSNAESAVSPYSAAAESASQSSNGIAAVCTAGLLFSKHQQAKSCSSLTAEGGGDWCV